MMKNPRVLMCQFPRALVFGMLVLAALTTTVSASGKRSAVLIESQIEGYRELTLEEFEKQSLHYAGSTLKWHVFMRVDTFSGGGMPTDQLSVYKVDAGSVSIANGWKLHFSEREISPRDCPQAKPATDGSRKWFVPTHASARERCGT